MLAVEVVVGACCIAVVAGGVGFELAPHSGMWVAGCMIAATCWA